MIVEDEPVSQEILKRYIDDYGQLDLIAVCNNAIEALAVLKLHSVDFIFLDIAMPKLSGIDFYRSLSNPPEVIFTTAYPQYAVDGFELNAVDYLVKPFSFERFMKAINKLEGLSSTVTHDFIMLQADKKMHRVAIEQILFVEALGDYVKVHLPQQVLIVHQTLQKMLDLLPSERFMRIHKSYVIALQKINYIEGNMVMIEKDRIPVGQTYRNDFLIRMQGGR